MSLDPMPAGVEGSVRVPGTMPLKWQLPLTVHMVCVYGLTTPKADQDLITPTIKGMYGARFSTHCLRSWMVLYLTPARLKLWPIPFISAQHVLTMNFVTARMTSHKDEGRTWGPCSSTCANHELRHCADDVTQR
jgi:hypothetical protein